MAELLAEAEFIEKRQSAKIYDEKLKTEEEYATSKAKVKILEAIESEDLKRESNVDGQYKGEINRAIDQTPEIQHRRTKQYHYDQGSVWLQFDFSLIKQRLYEKTVKGNQANATRWAPTRERYKNVNVLDSENVSETLCKLLKLQVDMKSFDGNVLNYHHFMALFKEVVESKVETPEEDWLPSNEGFTVSMQNICQRIYMEIYIRS